MRRAQCSRSVVWRPVRAGRIRVGLPEIGLWARFESGRARRGLPGRRRQGRVGVQGSAMKGFRASRELVAPSGVREIRRGRQRASPPPRAARGAGTANRFSSRSRPDHPAEIPGGFSSSLLPPSFPRGRSATPFFPSGARPPAGPPAALRRDEANRRRRCGNRRARDGSHARAHRPGHAVRGRRPLRWPHAHGRRHAGRAHARRRHRLCRLQRAQLPAARGAFRRARRRDGAGGHVVLGADPVGGHRMEQRQPRRSSRSARTCSGRRSGTCSARSCASTGSPRGWCSGRPRATAQRSTTESAISSPRSVSRAPFATGTCCP
jgi:hypothetical protein